jgi:hypothetical protein
MACDFNINHAPIDIRLNSWSIAITLGKRKSDRHDGGADSLV